MSVAYTPINIKFDPVDTGALLEYVRSNHIKNIDYTSKLCMIATRHEIYDWTNADEVFGKETTGYKEKEDYQIHYAPGIKQLFPSIVNLLQNLPYKQLIAAAFNLHEQPLYPHQDEVDDSYPLTPERYNVLLTNHFSQKSFYICETETSEKIYPTILEEYPVYAFDNRNYFHGADPVLDDRIILVCAGVIDKEKHDKLIQQSIEKFDRYVVKF